MRPSDGDGTHETDPDWNKPGSNGDDANDDDSGFKYVRMFLGCSLYGDNAALDTMDPNDLKYDAALVLWKRDDDNDEIEVHSAISFGTIPLTDAHREEYAENRPGMLPGVGMDAWNHLESKGQVREMVIPKVGFLYKVYQNPVSRSYNDTSKVDADPQQDYFTGEGIGNFVVVSTSNLFNS